MFYGYLLNPAYESFSAGGRSDYYAASWARDIARGAVLLRAVTPDGMDHGDALRRAEFARAGDSRASQYYGVFRWVEVGVDGTETGRSWPMDATGYEILAGEHQCHGVYLGSRTVQSASDS